MAGKNRLQATLARWSTSTAWYGTQSRGPTTKSRNTKPCWRTCRPYDGTPIYSWDKYPILNVFRGTGMAQEKRDEDANCRRVFAPMPHSYTALKQTTADYYQRPLGSNGWYAASTSRLAWGLGARGAGLPCTGKYTAATVRSYVASKSMKLQ